MITAMLLRVRFIPLLDRLRAAGCNSRVGDLLLSGDLTPGITRRPETLEVDDKRRVGGRVHAVVRLRFGHSFSFLHLRLRLHFLNDLREAETFPGLVGVEHP